MKVRKLVEVDRRGDEILVFSQSQTTDRFWVTNGFLRRLPSDTGAGNLADVVREALAASEQGIAVPPPAERPFDQFLPTLGVPSYAAYVIDTVAVMVELEQTDDGETVYVDPQQHSADGPGFEPLPDAATELSAPSAQQLSEAIIAALQTAKQARSRARLRTGSAIHAGRAAVMEA